MRLYITAAGVYAGTQAEAKRDGKGWHEEMVPTDKTGLIDYLNKLKYGDCVDMVEVQPVDAELTTPEKIEAETADVETNWSRDEIVNSNTPEAQREAAVRMTPSVAGQTTWTATEIEDFILHRASTAQVENIFGCLGNRFATLAKAKVELTGLLD